MPVDLRDLITASFDAAAAEAWSKFTLDEADKLALREAAMKVPGLFPGRIAGQCASMSAAYSIALEAHVRRIQEFDGKALFSKSTRTGMVMLGSSMAITLRTSRSSALSMPEARACCLNS
jgi:hypothetical protein